MSRALACVLLLFVAVGPSQAQGRRGVDRAPKVGTKAPDFALHRLDAKGASKEKVKLSELLKTKPVALVFGSYT